MRVVIGLGTNLGDRLATMREAVRRIATFADVVSRSHVYETAPIGPDQPDYLNAAVLVEWRGTALDLLDELRRIEADLGRDREKEMRWGPRTMDLDMLWIDGLVVDEPRLSVPHPRMHERAFALAPLLDVAPEATNPRTNEHYTLPDGQTVTRSNRSL
ncbi:2-amino-4-hydroxy-6-hydroxymethyldihydropteridine pyrophosphokinase [Labilithrix luteola]|uniref:2-amino-4-hydroxy-6-hydroxymethyldihydropteridine pyrophosphokinase n=1 Tax=Labilithrix luteola TaxID=1391654 RepID=A0A0K1PKG2_9BACT|nr:2-amino-4-hydroxy-6-hydroxymethyldihydropteridine diphosphokinase [Labilithrix luteola]AKU94028.1 2-amino-4-hydroxy-6-hydroxymethyldihydropteridine pyrophosphokinase [Labilithrix luteola]